MAITAQPGRKNQGNHRGQNMLKKLFISFGVMLLVAGCSSVTGDIQIETEVDPKVNLAGYSTYSWLGSAAIVYDPEGKWEPPQFDADAEIRSLIKRELAAHGMSESADNPDMIVAYAAGIDMTMMDMVITPESKLVKLANVPMGALAIILMEARTGQALWGGIATAEVQQDPSQEVIKKRLDYAGSSMFKKLPG